jgi:hypothetical protein
MEMKDGVLSNELIYGANVEEIYRTIEKIELEEFNIFEVHEEVQPELLLGETAEKTGYEFNSEEKIITPTFKISGEIEVAKILKKNELKSLFKIKMERPRVDTGLGFFVDGGYNDLENYKIAKELGTEILKDADNKIHQIKKQNVWDKVIKAIQENGFKLMKKKWDLENEISDLKTIKEVNDYSLKEML